MKITPKTFIVLIIFFLFASCVPSEHTPPEVYSLETIENEYIPIAKEVFGEDVYFWDISYILNNSPIHLSLGFLSYKYANRFLVISVFEDGTYKTETAAVGANHIAPPPLDQFMKIDSNKVLEIFYEDEKVQKSLNTYSLNSLDFKFYDGNCSYPIWVLTLGDAAAGAIHYYLDLNSLEIWEGQLYRDSDEFKQNCKDMELK